MRRVQEPAISRLFDDLFFLYLYRPATGTAAYTVGKLIETQRSGTVFDASWIWKSILIQIIFVFLRFLFDYFRARLQEPISYQLTARDRLAIGDALKRVSLGYFEHISTGHILNSITTSLSTLEGMGIRMIDNFVGGYLNFLVIFIGLAIYSPVMALIALATATLSLCFMLLISHSSRRNSPTEAQANRDMTGAIIEYARGLAVVKSFGKSGASMASLTRAVHDSAHTLGVIDDAMNQLDALRAENFIDADGRDIRLDHDDIEFENVSFGYDSRTVLENVSFRIPERTSTAIVGPSGSGKTTICNLMARFYDPQAGHITIGGHDLREFTCDSLLSHISMVSQNVYLFHDTIRANICFGRPEATENEVMEASKKARCHDFIMALPDGYDTVVGEGGGTLSGGEKQRISIASAILKDAPIIILDEATASIDPENEHLIQQAISELTKGKTVITIAHRLATVRNADQILVVDNGRIVESGTHKELMAQNGLYRHFTEIREKAESWHMATTVSAES